MMVEAVFNSFSYDLLIVFPLLSILVSPPLSDAFMVPFRLFVSTSVVDIVTTALLENVPVQFIVDTLIKGSGLLISIPDQSITWKF